MPSKSCPMCDRKSADVDDHLRLVHGIRTPAAREAAYKLSKRSSKRGS